MKTRENKIGSKKTPTTDLLYNKNFFFKVCQVILKSISIYSLKYFNICLKVFL